MLEITNLNIKKQNVLQHFTQEIKRFPQKNKSKIEKRATAKQRKSRPRGLRLDAVAAKAHLAFGISP